MSDHHFPWLLSDFQLHRLKNARHLNKSHQLTFTALFNFNFIYLCQSNKTFISKGLLCWSFLHIKRTNWPVFRSKVRKKYLILFEWNFATILPFSYEFTSFFDLKGWISQEYFSGFNISTFLSQQHTVSLFSNPRLEQAFAD